jgi:hypothetical protein
VSSTKCSYSHADLKNILKELQRHWAKVVEAVRINRNINTITIHCIEENILLLLEHSYARSTAVFPPGKVLVNTARQCAEVRALVTEFTRDLKVLNRHGAALSYEDQLKFVSNRYLTLYSPIMKAFGGAETGLHQRLLGHSSANRAVHTWCTLCTPCAHCAHCAHWPRASRGRSRYVVIVSLPYYLEQAACIARI